LHVKHKQPIIEKDVIDVDNEDMPSSSESEPEDGDIHPAPKEEMFAVQRGRGEKFVSDNSKCIGTSKGGGFWNDPFQNKIMNLIIVMT
jgi:hypothetical protein